MFVFRLGVWVGWLGLARRSAVQGLVPSGVALNGNLDGDGEAFISYPVVESQGAVLVGEGFSSSQSHDRRGEPLLPLRFDAASEARVLRGEKATSLSSDRKGASGVLEAWRESLRLRVRKVVFAKQSEQRPSVAPLETPRRLASVSSVVGSVPAGDSSVVSRLSSSREEAFSCVCAV